MASVPLKCSGFVVLHLADNAVPVRAALAQTQLHLRRIFTNAFWGPRGSHGHGNGGVRVVAQQVPSNNNNRKFHLLETSSQRQQQRPRPLPWVGVRVSVTSSPRLMHSSDSNESRTNRRHIRNLPSSTSKASSDQQFRCLQRYYFNNGEDPTSFGGKSPLSKGPLCCELLSRESAQKILQTKQRIRETKDRVRERVEDIVQRENIVTVPNILCVTRIALSPVIGYLVLHHNFDLALAMFMVAGITDLLDGQIARTFPSQQSMLGSFLDPMADKLLVSVLFLTLTAAQLIPVPLTALIIVRDVGLVAAGFYIRYVSLPAPKTMARYFDVTHATARLSPTLISKVNTAIQLSLVAVTLAAPVFDYIDHPYLQTLWYITAATTVTSGLSYLFTKDTFKLLKKKASPNFRRTPVIGGQSVEK